MTPTGTAIGTPLSFARAGSARMLRQGEVLGLRWDDVDLATATVRTLKTRLRPKYRHGCDPVGTCGRKSGYCRRRSTPERRPAR